jgi:methanol metabolism-related c-type cytochrome
LIAEIQVTRRFGATLAAAVVFVSFASAAVQAEPAKPAREDGGKYFDAEDKPTYNIKGDGTVDWFTYSGYRRYHAECHTCHGPDGLGSTYAPSLVDSLKKMTYDQFVEVIIQGRQNVSAGVQKVMPSFGTNNNVACYLDDLYVYLRARSDSALDRVRPAKREDKSQAAIDAERTCLGAS